MHSYTCKLKGQLTNKHVILFCFICKTLWFYSGFCSGLFCQVQWALEVLVASSLYAKLRMHYSNRLSHWAESCGCTVKSSVISSGSEITYLVFRFVTCVKKIKSSWHLGQSVGMLVEDLLAGALWLLETVKAVKPGHDDRVHTVEVLVKDKTFTGSAAQLIPYNYLPSPSGRRTLSWSNKRQNCLDIFGSRCQKEQ